jgi:uncharacterized repeat protein (TIGR01451 family)
MKRVLLALASLSLSAFAAGAAGSCFTDTAQADFQAGLPAGVDLTSSPNNVLLASSSGGGGNADQENLTYTNYGDEFNTSQWVAQTFTPGVSGSLTRVDVNFACGGCSGTPPPVTVSVRATSGGLPVGSDLASATIPTFSPAGATFNFYSANFAAPATLAARTQYAIVIRLASTYAGGLALITDSALGGYTGNDVYAGGGLLMSTNSGGSWTLRKLLGNGQGIDAVFITYMGGGGGGYVSSGNLTSSAKDSSPGAGSTTWSTLSWTNSAPSGTAITFQAAASNTSAGPYNFVGPDGTANSFFATSGASLSQFNGNRYLKYRAYLATNSSGSTPVLSEATWCYTTAVSADLSITNTDGALTEIPGTPVTYTITASNSAGSSSVTGATVTDTFPQALSACTWSCTGTSGGTCPASGSGNINNSVNLPAGASVSFLATCSIAASATGTLTNTASISSSTADPAPGNNSVNDVDTLTPQADLSISNSDGAASVSAGGTTTYTLVATNNGPSNVTGATVTDTFPASLTCTWTCSPSSGSSCPASGSGNIGSSVSLLNGGSATFTASCTISAGASGTITNTATIGAPNGVTDPATGNNTGTDTDSVGVAAGPPTLSLTDNLDFVRVGDVVSYVIHVTNPGSTITPTVTDTLPAQLSAVSWNCSASGGATCGSSGTGGNGVMPDGSPTLPAGGAVDYTYTATVLAANSNGEVSNTAAMKVTGHAGTMSANDADTVVVFMSGFDGGTTPLVVTPGGGSATGSVTAQFGVDGGLLAKLGPAPVTVASAQSASGQTLFSMQLMRSGNDVLLRSLTTIDGGPFSDVSPWQVVDLRALRFGFEWQSARTGDDGFLRAGSASQQKLIAANNSRETPTQLRVAVVNGIPWLALVEP